METNISYTSILTPRRRLSLLTRPRLIERLTHLIENRLTLIVAPAGYGKTSLLVDFADQSSIAFCWYSVDRHTHTPHQFLSSLVAAISQKFPGFGQISKAVIGTCTCTEEEIERVATILANEIYDTISDQFRLVLDDFQYVDSNKPILAFLNCLVQKTPDVCHTVLISRRLPALPDLDLMRARSQAGSISLTDLAFSAEEIQALALHQERCTLSATLATEIAQEAEGWITGVLLSTEHNWTGIRDRIRTARAAGGELYDYLAGQLLDQQSPDLREFLLRSSVLGEFHPDLLQAVLGATIYSEKIDWEKMIEALRRENLFILPVGNGMTWYRYHAMFRDFLQAKLNQERPGEKAVILGRLAAIFRANRNWEGAYNVYQDLKDVNSIIELVEEAGSTLLKDGRFLTLLDWVDQLPEAVILSRPALLSIKGCLFILTGKAQEGIPLLNQAEAAFRNINDLPHLARTLVRRATAYHTLGDYPASLQDAEETLALVGDCQELSELKAEALRYQGLNLLWLDRPDEAIKTLKAAHFTYRLLFDEINTANLLQDLGLAYRVVGELALSRNSYEQALDQWRETRQKHQIAHILNNLAMVFQSENNFEQASETYNEALAFARRSGNVRAEAFILTGIGDLYTLLDAPAAAERAYQQARALAEKIQHRYLHLHLRLAEATLALRRDDLFMARSFQAAAREYLGDCASAYEHGLYLNECAKLALQETRHPEAIELFGQAFQFFSQAQRKQEARQAQFMLAVVLCAQGEMERAGLEFSKLPPQADLFQNYNLVNVLRTSGKKCLQTIVEHSPAGSHAHQFMAVIQRFEQQLPSVRRRIRAQKPIIPFDPPQIIIRCLGDAMVEVNGVALTHADWRVQVARDLFFFLVNSPAGASRGTIGLDFWCEKSPELLRSLVKGTIHRMRTALGQDDIILHQYDRYEFNRKVDYECDVEIFLDKLFLGNTADSPERRASYFREAITLYCGNYLSDVTGGWVMPERERLRLLYLGAIQDLAKYHLEKGEFQVCQDYCLRALQKDPCLEEAHRLLMLAFAAQGNQAAMIHQYQMCMQSIHETYSMPPSKTTQELFQNLTG